VVGNPANLQLQNFTIEAWIQRTSASQTSASAGGGIVFGYGSHGYQFGLLNNGVLFLSEPDVAAVSSAAQVTDLNWHHVGVSKTGSTVVFYMDGTAYPAAAFNQVFAFTTSAAIGLLADRTADTFLGSIDEVDVFNRPLTATEMQAIYNGGDAGKCGVLPAINLQPASQATILGGNVTFSVAATGTPTLTYQWSFNGANLDGATGSSLTLGNVQFSQAGSYAVLVANAVGSVASSNAILTVTPPPSVIQVVNVTAASGIITVPINLIAQGNENALGYSINFDPTLLTFTGINLGSGAQGASLISNTNQIGNGQLGVALALSA